MISVRSIAPDDWPLYRDMRLKALLDAPDAFGSTYEAEAGRADENWSARLAVVSSGRDLGLFAFNGAASCGLVWCKLSASEPDRADVYQMWVAPVARGLGAGRALLDGAVAWARDAGVRRVCLGATVADTPAMHLYVSYGFRAEGVPEPLREGSSLMAQQMVLTLDADRSRP